MIGHRDAEVDAFLAGVGQLVEQRRTDRNLTRAQLAELAAVSKGFVAQLEAGARGPNLLMLLRVAEALGTQPGRAVAADAGAGR